MLQLLPQSDIYKPMISTPADIVNQINTYIQASDSPDISIDISGMNPIDSSYVLTMCSTTHYIKYCEGMITWLVSSDIVESLCKNMTLDNAGYVVV